jgi:hypothetical protein
MFDSKQTLTTRLADAADLFIDFATLGEYGLEPVGRTRQGCVDPSRAHTRASARQAQCSLLQEAGFRRPRRPAVARRLHKVDGPFLLRP